MRIIVSLLDGNMRKGNVEEDTLIRDLAARLKLEPDNCLTLAGVRAPLCPVMQWAELRAKFGSCDSLL